ncbi:hypothetical protein PTRA_a1594 [Pseudoalteromonas translucida KMM 520]|uniref:Endonuclease/exonuclease/phosphatase domain-containing protein n=1 Tax=Pseudoalteromonas translucida KMM 520 TaxID=1315283 RepID=A0A0U2V474_9GAMM|nr:endonuclease/exonuclease/phosphatase family protein [Pseudoalteromonas translucida]ALS32781.1 hypothetical protein PTRA_a1594 [Pseudoalteromonas translucida KMM 520]
MLSVFVICTVVTVIATLLPLSRHPHWIVRGMDFPRLQIAIIALLLLIAQSILLDVTAPISWGLILATLFCLIWQLTWILPYTRMWRSEVKTAKDANPQHQLSILTSNVLTPNRNADALIELVNKHQPDVLVTLESDKWWEKQLEVLEQAMPHSVKCPLDNLYGMHVYSRLTIDEHEVSYLVEKEVPSIHILLRLRSGDKVRVHFVHPAPPSPTENPESAERDAELVIVARSVAQSEQPVIVTGDLNDVAWSATTRLFRKVSGLLDPRVGRGMFNTFHVGFPFLRWPLDHLFHSTHFTIHSIERLPSIESDHFPLFTRLQFAPQSGAEQQGLSSDENHHQWAKEITEQQGVNELDVPQPGEPNKFL